MIESLQDFKDMCEDVWYRYRTEVHDVTVTASASERITRDVLMQPSSASLSVTDDDPPLIKDEHAQWFGVRIDKIVNPVTRTYVNIHVVPDPVAHSDDDCCADPECTINTDHCCVCEECMDDCGQH